MLFLLQDILMDACSLICRFSQILFSVFLLAVAVIAINWAAGRKHRHSPILPYCSLNGTFFSVAVPLQLNLHIRWLWTTKKNITHMQCNLMNGNVESTWDRKSTSPFIQKSLCWRGEVNPMPTITFLIKNSSVWSTEYVYGLATS